MENNYIETYARNVIVSRFVLKKIQEVKFIDNSRKMAWL